MNVPDYLKEVVVEVDLKVSPEGKRTSVAKVRICDEHHEQDGSVTKQTRDDYTSLVIQAAAAEFVRKYSAPPDPDHQTMVIVHHDEVVMGGICDTASIVADPFS